VHDVQGQSTKAHEIESEGNILNFTAEPTDAASRVDAAHDQTFGNWVRARREQRGLTREQLAYHIGCSAVTIYKIETGERRPSVQMARLLAQHLEIAPDQVDAFVQVARAIAQSTKTTTRADAPSVATLSPTNLPIALTRLIGRARDLSALRAHLSNVEIRLLTIVGAPGVGKTQLALAAAHAAHAAHVTSDGVFYVPLAALTDADAIPSAIMQAVSTHAPAQAADATWASLHTHLVHANVLLVLDNAEHLPAIATHLAALLEAAPQVRVLVTSRKPLHIRREFLHPLHPLDRDASMTLFAARAQAVRPDFALTADNVSDIAAICQRLSGLPLAIELAAARVRMFTPAALRARLADGAYASTLDVLSQGAVDAPARHQTLLAAIDWSLALLNVDERNAFHALSVFPGRAALPALCAVAQLGESAMLKLMSSLVEHNLVYAVDADASDDAVWFDMLSSLRDFARAKLMACGDFNALCIRHATYFYQQALHIDRPLRSGANRDVLLACLSRDHDNYRAAFVHLLNLNTGESALAAAAMADALWIFWRNRNHWREPNVWMSRLLTQLQQHAPHHVDTHEAQAKVLRITGNLVHLLGETDRGITCLERAVELARHAEAAEVLGLSLANLASLEYMRGDMARAKTLVKESLNADPANNDERGVAFSLDTLGEIALAEGHFAEALGYWGKTMPVWRRTGDTNNLAIALVNSATAHINLGALDVANTQLQEAITLAHEIDNRHIEAVAAGNLAECLLQQNNPQAAQTQAKRSLTLAHDIGSLRDVASALDNLALCAARLSHTQRATTLLAAATQLRETRSIALVKTEQLAHDTLVAELQSLPNDTAHGRAALRGQAMTVQQAVAFALESD
jgi:predicted ATPase/DNA-binding XRE family transcriptional regulator/Tfp pilus assembly protein PilF